MKESHNFASQSEKKRKKNMLAVMKTLNERYVVIKASKFTVFEIFIYYLSALSIHIDQQKA